MEPEWRNQEFTRHIESSVSHQFYQWLRSTGAYCSVGLVIILFLMLIFSMIRALVRLYKLVVLHGFRKSHLTTVLFNDLPYIHDRDQRLEDKIQELIKVTNLLSKNMQLLKKKIKTQDNEEDKFEEVDLLSLNLENSD